VETSVCLAPGAVGRGLGAQLCSRLFEALAGKDVHRALAGITLPNEASVRLHQGFGFRLVGIFRENGRKLGRYWDVAWYEKPLWRRGWRRGRFSFLTSCRARCNARWAVPPARPRRRSIEASESPNSS